MPHVEKWLRGRGFEPGMGIQKAYATVLGGNPYANLDKEDSFGTTPRSGAARMLPGGDLYKRAQDLYGPLSPL